MRFTMLVSRILPAIALSIVAVMIGFVSLGLRPISDDYCLGASALGGPLASIIFWLSEWSGSPFGVAVQALLVSWPLALHPFGFASALAYIASGLIVGLLTSFLLANRWKRNILNSCFLVISIAVGWWVSFRVGQVVELRAGDDPAGNRSWVIAEILTHWQTVNGGVAATALASWFLAWSLFSERIHRVVQRWGAIAVASIFVGWAGYQFAIALALALLLVSIAMSAVQRSEVARRIGFSSIMIIVGTASTFAFPGSRSRVETNLDLGFAQVLNGIRNSPAGLRDWVTDVFSAPTLFAVFLGITIALVNIARRQDWENNGWRRYVPPVLLLASLFIYGLNEIIGAVLYSAPWHTVSARMMIFVSAILMGHLAQEWWVGKSVGPARQGVLSAAQSVILVGILSMTVIGAATIWSSVEERKQAWDKGPAPVSQIVGMSDREAPWVAKCWRTLSGGDPEA
jgi:hypothetical protein